MDAQLKPPPKLSGTMRIPPDKAICHRVVLLAALAEGATQLRPWPAAEDCQRTLNVVKALGARVSSSADGVTIEGCGDLGLRASQEPLDCGESGTTLRLAAGLLAGQPFASVLAASPSLAKRPMRRIADPLAQMGAAIEGRLGNHEIYPPLTIKGRRPLKAIRYETPVASAQIKSAILLAGLFADAPTTVTERHATRDHTERALSTFGIRVLCSGSQVSVTPGGLRSPQHFFIPGDLSSAAFLLVAASIVPGSEITLLEVGNNPTRTGVIDVLRKMGARIHVQARQDAGEPYASLTASSSVLSAVTIEPGQVPGLIDELPVLMVAAAMARGTSRFRGVGELRVKETDRISSMVSGLARLGAVVRVIEPDVIEIEGGHPLKGATVDSAGDHRTAMSLAVAALGARGSSVIQGSECVSKSFPEFFSLLGRLAGGSTVKTVDKP